MMFSLSKIATFALLALSATARTVPEKRATETAPQILDTLAEELTPIAAKFASLNPSITSIPAAQGIVAQMVPLISAASTKIAALPPGSSDKTATIKSLAGVFSASLTPAHQFVTNAGPVSAVTIVPIFTQIGVTLAALLTNVVTLVEEVLTVVVDLLEGLVAGLETTLTGLGLTSLTSMGF